MGRPGRQGEALLIRNLHLLRPAVTLGAVFIAGAPVAAQGIIPDVIGATTPTFPNRSEL